MGLIANMIDNGGALNQEYADVGLEVSARTTPVNASLDFKNTYRITHLPDAVLQQDPTTLAQVVALLQAQTDDINTVIDLDAKVDTIAALRALTVTPTTLLARGYHVKDDNAFGSHFFKWNATSTDDDNGGTIIKVTAITTGRYELQHDGMVLPRWFGAHSITEAGYSDYDSTPAIQSAIDSGAGTVVLGNSDDVFYLNSFRSAYDPANGGAHDWLTLLAITRSNLTILGNGATLKLGAVTHDEEFALMYNYNALIKNVHIRGIVFEGNSANSHMVTRYHSVRAVIRLDYAVESSVTHCVFNDFSAIHSIFMGVDGPSVYARANNIVEFNTFKNVNIRQEQYLVVIPNSNPVTYYGRDHTTVYITSLGSRVSNNIFISEVSADPVAGLYSTVYEIHNHDAIFKDNTVMGYSRGFIIAAFETSEDVGFTVKLRDISIIDNHFRTISACGITDSKPQYNATFENIHVNNNILICDRAGYSDADVASRAIFGGFVFPSIISTFASDNTTPNVHVCRNFSIKNNTIVIPNIVPDPDVYAGVSVHGVWANQMSLDGLYVEGNSITYAGKMTSFKILNNSVEDRPQSYKNVVFKNNTMAHSVSGTPYEEAIVVYDFVPTSSYDSICIMDNILSSPVGYYTAMRLLVNINAQNSIQGWIIEGATTLMKEASIQDVIIPAWLFNLTHRARLKIAGGVLSIPPVLANTASSAHLVLASMYEADGTDPAGTPRSAGYPYAHQWTYRAVDSDLLDPPAMDYFNASTLYDYPECTMTIGWMDMTANFIPILSSVGNVTYPHRFGIFVTGEDLVEQSIIPVRDIICQRG